MSPTPECPARPHPRGRLPEPAARWKSVTDSPAGTTSSACSGWAAWAPSTRHGTRSWKSRSRSKSSARTQPRIPDLAAEIERRFKRELLLARQVTHPNVVRIHDLGEFEGIKYITMPYIQGTDLGDDPAKKGTLPVPEALPVAAQIAAGLLAAHDAGVIHRDLKPANIMIDANGHALIADFGIARASGTAEPAVAERRAAETRQRRSAPNDATQIGTVIGSIDYMAPEQARGEKVDHRADIYAFGLILYRMLVGRRFAPGATDTFADLKARMETEPTRLREVDPTIPEAVDALVSRCLQPDPGRAIPDDQGSRRRARPPRRERQADARIRPSFLSSCAVPRRGRRAVDPHRRRSRGPPGSCSAPTPRWSTTPSACWSRISRIPRGTPPSTGCSNNRSAEGIEKASFITAYQRPRPCVWLKTSTPAPS